MFGATADSSTMISMFQGKRRYVQTEPMDVANSKELKRFFNDVKSKKVAPKFRSQPPPETVHEDGILVLTGDTFEQTVMNEQHDVLVAFDSPDCKKCSDTVQPMLKELASKAWKKG